MFMTTSEDLFGQIANRLSSGKYVHDNAYGIENFGRPSFTALLPSLTTDVAQIGFFMATAGAKNLVVANEVFTAGAVGLQLIASTAGAASKISGVTVPDSLKNLPGLVFLPKNALENLTNATVFKTPGGDWG